MSEHAAPSRLQGLATSIHWAGAGRMIARTAGFNMASAVAAGLGGVVLARALGPTVRGEYAAITAWFGIALIVGGMGQPAALCFYVARDPLRAREYVATSRAMMLATGGLALAAGILLAPILSHGNPEMATGYRIAFGASIVAFVGASYTFSLQARDIHQWNVVRVSQPVLSLLAVGVLWRLQLLTLPIALIVLATTMVLQLVWAYHCCRLAGLVPGRLQTRLLRPLATYGAAQIAAVTPAALNSQPGPADPLSNRASSRPRPLRDRSLALIAPYPSSRGHRQCRFPAASVAACGRPRLPVGCNCSPSLQREPGRGDTCTARLGRVLAGASSLRPRLPGAVPLLWILTPGAVFLACGQVVGDLLRGRNHPNVVAWAEGLAASSRWCCFLRCCLLVGVSGAAIASTVAYGVALAVMLRSLWCLPRRSRKGHRASTPESLAVKPKEK